MLSLSKKNVKKQEKCLKHIESCKEGLSVLLYKNTFNDEIQIFWKLFEDFFLLNDILNEKDAIRKLKYQKIQDEFSNPGWIYSNRKKYPAGQENNIRSSNFIISKTTSKNECSKIIDDTLLIITFKETDLNLR